MHDRLSLKGTSLAGAFMTAPGDGVDGLRAALIGISHFGIATDIAVICAITAVFMGLGTYFFSRIQL